MGHKRTWSCVLLAAIAPLVSGQGRAQSRVLDDYALVAERSIRFGANNVIASGNVAVDAARGLLFSKRGLEAGDGTHICSPAAGYLTGVALPIARGMAPGL